jgi:hypothetical protein
MIDPALLERLRAETARKRAEGRRPRPPCRHLGPPTGRSLPVYTCGCAQLSKAPEVPVRSCALRGECTDQRVVKGLPCCRFCPLQEDPP